MEYATIVFRVLGFGVNNSKIVDGHGFLVGNT